MERRREPTVLTVHRCRFIDYAPSAITALAFPPLPLPSINGKKKSSRGKHPLRHAYGTLAVGHANGNIDICEWVGAEDEAQSHQAWIPRKTIAGPYPSKVDSLAFTIRYPDDLVEGQVPKCSDLRLFSSGGGSELLEWDIENSCLRRTVSSQGGAIWCIAVNPSSTTLAMGCEDGTVRLLSLLNDTLTHLRRFDRVKCRVLSVAWGPPLPRKPKQKNHDVNGRSDKPNSENSLSDSDSDDDDDGDQWDDSWIVTGGSDSSVRKWDVATGRVVDRMGVDKVRGERTLVWTVGVLGDGTIVSGDSLGMVKFWDSKTCTLLQNFPAHNADVLCLTINPEGKAVYTSGVDQKTVQFSLVTTTNNNDPNRWARTASKRMHSHDIRALASWPPYTPLPTAFQSRRTALTSRKPPVAPILVSGGLDMNLVLAPAALPASTISRVINPLVTSAESTFEDAYHRRVAYPVAGRVCVSFGARLAVCVREAGLALWRIKNISVKRPPWLLDAGIAENEARGKEVDSMDVDMEDGEGGERTADGPKLGGDEEVEYKGGWEKVLEMDLNVSTNIVACAVSDDGRWLAVSDRYETKLFALNTDRKDNLVAKRIRDFAVILSAHIPSFSANSSSSTLLTGAQALTFTPDSKRLVLATAASGHILFIDLDGSPRVLRRFDHHRVGGYGRAIAGSNRVRVRVTNDEDENQGGEQEESGDEDAKMRDESGGDGGKDSEDDECDVGGGGETSVTMLRLVVSSDGQWLASSDDRCRTHIFNLDSITHHTALPTLPHPTLAFSFTPRRSGAQLVLALADNSLHIFDVESRAFWSSVNGLGLEDDMSRGNGNGNGRGTLLQAGMRRLADMHDPVLGMLVARDRGMKPGSDGGGEYAILWGSTWMCKIPLGALASARKGGDRSNHKRRRSEPQNTQAQSPVDEQDPYDHALPEFLPPHMAETDSKIRFITNYRPILCAAFVGSIGAEELVIVERPLVDVLAGLPPAFFKHRYGT